MFDIRAKEWNRWAKIGCGAGLVCMLIGAAFALYRLDYLKHEVTTKATITDLIERGSDNGDTLYAPVYVFSDGRGELVTVTSLLASSPPAGKIGDVIEILYDPDNPKHSIENRLFSIWGIPAIFGGLGVFDFIISASVVLFTQRYLNKNTHLTQATAPISAQTLYEPPPVASVQRLSFVRNKFWLFVRCIIYAWCIASAVFETVKIRDLSFPSTESLSIWFLLTMSLIFGSFLAFTALMVSAVISFSSLGFGFGVTRPWARPRHAANPFSLFGPPLGFFHFSGFVLIAIGFGLFVGACWSGVLTFLGGVLVVAFGGAILGGLYFGMACCKNNFRPMKVP